jgi:four helix bundle protein
MLQLAHKSLEIYTIGKELVIAIYELTERYPKDEKFGLVSQLRRAVISICSNLAEGSSRFSRAERKRFYEIARGSVVEIDTQFDISVLLGYTTKEALLGIEPKLESVFKMLSKMITTLSNNPSNE